jgi:hypothetical protein
MKAGTGTQHMTDRDIGHLTRTLSVNAVQHECDSGHKLLASSELDFPPLISCRSYQRPEDGLGGDEAESLVERQDGAAEWAGG